MPAEKTYGKLKADDIKALFLLLPKLEDARNGFQTLIAQEPEKFSAKFLSKGFTWAHLYESTFLQLLNTFLAIADVKEVVEKAVAEDNPVVALFDLADTIEDTEWSGGPGGKYTWGDLLGYLHALIGNLECLLIYGTYMNDLMAESKKGDLEPLLKAIRIDPSVVSGPTVGNLLSACVIAGDMETIAAVRKAMSGKTGKQAAYLKKFRLLMQTLHEVDALGLPTKEIMELVFKVGAYERAPGAEKSVRELILKAKALKENTISK